MKKWLVYFINSLGHREGTEYIWAVDRVEALELYQRYFNVSNHEVIKVIPVVGVDCERG